ncbi:MAG TPA: glycosyltransferase family protein [Polyangiaceae bacterium]|jgi:spore coat polysaccharide biosynthesis protein SpsF|nr:glycosyltransferase family protein [Polyangiaceae bacterium]
MTLVVVIQARVSSTRLPGKVLLPLSGKPMLERQIERILAAKSRFELCVATTTNPGDEPIRQICKKLSVRCFDGHPLDLLDRHYRVALTYAADAVVKIPSDCPLIDPAAIDRVISRFEATRGKFDFVTNLNPPTWPDGNDVEVMTFEALETAFREATRPLEREHTTPFIWENPERFRIENVRWESGLDYSKSHRFTVDHAQDFSFVSRIYDALCTPLQPLFSLREILDLLRDRPEIYELNAPLRGQSWHLAHAAELKHFYRSSEGNAV